MENLVGRFHHLKEQGNKVYWYQLSWNSVGFLAGKVVLNIETVLSWGQKPKKTAENCDLEKAFCLWNFSHIRNETDA